MDFLEGLFLGKVWSDTDFENRRHFGLLILYALIVDNIVLFSYVTGKYFGMLKVTDTWMIVIYALLFLACPFICFRYYRFPWWGKIPVLLEKAFKFFLVICFTTAFVFSKITVQSSDLQEFLINYLNGTLEKYTEKYYETAGSFATVIGVAAGGVHIVFVFVLNILGAIAFPIIVFLAFRLVQYGYDWLMNKFLIRKVFGKRG